MWWKNLPSFQGASRGGPGGPSRRRAMSTMRSWLSRYFQSAIVCLALVMLSGCAIGPDYYRPAADIPQQFNYSLDAAPDQFPGGTVPWWEVFNDPTLTNLIQLALTNNYDIRIAAARVEQARALAEQARSQFFRQAGLRRQQLPRKERQRRQRQSRGQRAPPPVPSTAALNATWEIDLWGRVRRLNEAARAQFFASEEARRGVRLSSSPRWRRNISSFWNWTRKWPSPGAPPTPTAKV